MKYPVDVIKNDGGFSFERQKSLITGWATNAVNCAANLHPNAAKYYVSSDSSRTIKYLLEESRFVQNHTDATKHEEHQSAVKLVARDYSIENPHINFAKNLEPDQFMSVFEDLFIMGLGKCVAHGIGGYGRLAAALSGGECVMRHRGDGGNMNVCTQPTLSKNSQRMDYSAKNFTRFISYGQPRTASTTQFNMVCVCFVLHMKEHKPSLANATKCYFQGKGNHIYPSLDRPQGKYRFDSKGKFEILILVLSQGIYFTHLFHIFNSNENT